MANSKIKSLVTLIRRSLLFAGVIALVYLIGFFWFLAQIPGDKSISATKADAIVVLTGGPERIEAGMSLLTQGKGARLLVSGVNPDVKREELKSLLTGNTDRFDCCVDLGRRAESTIGNAAETAPWASDHRYESLLVVTSAYHMPRALHELAHTMPDTVLYGHAVFHDEVRLDEWWLYPGTARLLVSEYSKFLLTLVRLGSLDDA